MSNPFQPRIPTGFDSESSWLQWVQKRLLALKFRNSPTVRVNRDSKGYWFDVVGISQSVVASAPSSGASILQVISVNDNYLICGSTTPQSAQSITGLQLTAGGSSYTSVSVSITGGGGTGATATGTESGGAVSSLTLGSGGHGFTSQPTISITGGGTGATAIALFGNTKVALPILFQRQQYDGVTISLPDGSHTYAYVAPGKRTDTSSDPVTGNSPAIIADSFIYPPYLASSGPTPAAWSKVIAMTVPGGTGVAGASMIDIGTGRGWRNGQLICYNGTDAYILGESNPTATNIYNG